jgi:hypothetical protein
VSSSPIPLTLMMEALSSSETSVHTRAILRNVSEDSIVHSHCRENLKSYTALIRIGYRSEVYPHPCSVLNFLFVYDVPRYFAFPQSAAENILDAE